MAAPDYTQKFYDAYEAEKAKRKRPTVLVCGYTGSGKSSLIKAICGGIVPDDEIGDGRPKTMEYKKYETEDIRVYDSRGLELGETETKFTAMTKDFVRNLQNDSNVDNHIHLVWYAIQGSGARITDCDINLMQNIFDPNHLIVVLTKKDITRPDQLEALTARLIEAGVSPQRIVATSDLQSGAKGCKELMRLSYEMLPEAYRDAFMRAQEIDRETKIAAVYAKSTKAAAIILTATGSATGIAAAPIPVADAPILMGVQATMIGSLAGLYGFDRSRVSFAALPILARTAGMLAATSLSKMIPGLGSLIQATVAAAITGAMGYFVKDQFEKNAIAVINGQPIRELQFDPNVFQRYYNNYHHDNISG